jgi:hypothetical protein
MDGVTRPSFLNNQLNPTTNTFLSLVLEDFFSSDELSEMGILYHKHSTA